MFTKLTLATALIVGGAIFTADQSEASDRGNRGDQAYYTIDNPRQENRRARRVAPRRNFDRPRRHRFADRRNGWRYSDRRWYYGPRGRRFVRGPFYRKCVAVAKRRAGFGRRIRGIRGVARGFRACRIALRECRSELRYLKSFGRNPFARCVVVGRL